VITYAELPSVLLEQFPSSEDALRSLTDQRQGEGAVLAFGIISECFWWGIFEPALQANDVELIERCLQFTERLVSEGDSVIQEAVGIRVLDYLFDPAWKEVVLRYAGARVRGILTGSSGL
jgi:hypothetical protein